MKLLYFAWIRERTGLAEEIVDPPDEVLTAGDLISWLAARGENYAAAFAEPAVVRVALDQIHVDHDAPLSDAREIALFPPMTGG